MKSMSTMMKRVTGLTGQEHWRMMTGVTVITVTTTRTHAVMMTPTGGLTVGMTTGLGRPNMLPLRLQHCPNLSHMYRPAGFTDGRTAASTQSTAAAPNVSAVQSVNVTDVETSETHSHVRAVPKATASRTRTVHTKPGLFGAFIATVAVLNSFGRRQGLPPIPETVSRRLDFPDHYCHTDSYHDALSTYHDKCIAAVPSHEHWILFDSGAAAHCCPADYAPDYPRLPVGNDSPRQRSVAGKPLTILGRKLIKYSADGVTLFVNSTFVIFLFVWFLLPDCYYKVIGLVKIVWNFWRPKKKLSTLPGMAHCCTSHHPLWHTMRLSWIHMNVRWMSTWTHLVLILTALAYHNTTQALMQLINSKYLSMLSSHELTIILITGSWMKQGAHWQEFTNDLEDWCSCLTGQTALFHWTGPAAPESPPLTLEKVELKVETVTEKFNKLTNQAEMKKEHWKGRTVFSLEASTTTETSIY